VEKALKEPTRPADVQLAREVKFEAGNVSLAYKNILSDQFFYSL